MAHHQWIWTFSSLIWENNLALSSKVTETCITLASDSIFHTFVGKFLFVNTKRLACIWYYQLPQDNTILMGKLTY